MLERRTPNVALQPQRFLVMEKTKEQCAVVVCAETL